MGDGVGAGVGEQEVCNGPSYGASPNTCMEPGQYDV